MALTTARRLDAFIVMVSVLNVLMQVRLPLLLLPFSLPILVLVMYGPVSPGAPAIVNGVECRWALLCARARAQRRPRWCWLVHVAELLPSLTADTSHTARTHTHTWPRTCGVRQPRKPVTYHYRICAPPLPAPTTLLESSHTALNCRKPSCCGCCAWGALCGSSPRSKISRRSSTLFPMPCLWLCVPSVWPCQ